VYDHCIIPDDFHLPARIFPYDQGGKNLIPINKLAGEKQTLSKLFPFKLQHSMYVSSLFSPYCRTTRVICGPTLAILTSQSAPRNLGLLTLSDYHPHVLLIRQSRNPNVKFFYRFEPVLRPLSLFPSLSVELGPSWCPTSRSSASRLALVLSSL
jgi:hypothetical protein